MDQLDRLPPDLRATLSLLLRQGKSYTEIAELLGIPQSAVRDRAHAALDALAGAPPQAPPSQPVDPPASGPPPPPSGPPAAAPAPAASRPARGSSSPQSGFAAPPSQPGGSRRAGALLLSALALVIVVVAILIATSSGGGGSHTGTSAGAGTTTGSHKSTTAGEPHIDKQINLASPDPASKSVGLVEVLSQDSRRAFFVAAEHLPPTSGFFYAAWLYNSPSDARVLGRGPPVSANGKMQAVGALPTNAASFHQLLITRETTAKPAHPGPIVLSGPFSLK